MEKWAMWSGGLSGHSSAAEGQIYVCLQFYKVIKGVQVYGNYAHWGVYHNWGRILICHMGIFYLILLGLLYKPLSRHSPHF